jgi:hypothetical protein
MIKIQKEWAMPNANTFSIKPIAKLIHRHIKMLPDNAVIIDPFARNNKFGTITNDLDPDTTADYHLDAFDFLQNVVDKDEADMVLFDPPYSPRQVSEVYKKMGRSVNMQTTQASFWGNLKKEIARVTKPNGICISFGWNSGGIGGKLNFHQIEILLVAHGGWHNDTICTVEQKAAMLL